LLGRVRGLLAKAESSTYPAEAEAYTAKAQDLEFLKDLIEAGKVRPVVDRTYPLSGVPSAIRYLNEGRARGKVVITVRGTTAVPEGMTVAGVASWNGHITERTPSYHRQPQVPSQAGTINS